MIRHIAIALWGLSIACTADAAVTWLALQPEYSYADASYGCDNTLYPASVYLVMEQADGGVARAKLARSQQGDPSPLMLTPAEIGAIRTLVDYQDRRWITHFPFDDRIVKWLMVTSRHGIFPCQPSGPITSVAAEVTEFVFDMNAVHGGLSWADSQLIRFEGTIEGGARFSAAIRLRQEL